MDGAFWSVDKAFDWVVKQSAACLEARSQKPKQLKPPPPEVYRGVILGVQASGPREDPVVRNLFTSLLANAMTSGENRQCHPAFPDVLRQLSPEEARILAMIASGPYENLAEVLAFASVTANSPAPHKEHPFLRGHRKSGVRTIISGWYPEATTWPRFSHTWKPLSEAAEVENIELALGNLQRMSFPVHVDGSVRVTFVEPTIFGCYFLQSCAASDFFDNYNRKFKLPHWAK
ncbi:MAG TPA: Abi-alpha family protein [Verrucomicrobiae bacterium]